MKQLSGGSFKRLSILIGIALVLLIAVVLVHRGSNESAWGQVPTTRIPAGGVGLDDEQLIRLVAENLIIRAQGRMEQISSADANLVALLIVLTPPVSPQHISPLLESAQMQSSSVPDPFIATKLNRLSSALRELGSLTSAAVLDEQVRPLLDVQMKDKRNLVDIDQAFFQAWTSDGTIANLATALRADPQRCR